MNSAIKPNFNLKFKICQVSWILWIVHKIPKKRPNASDEKTQTLKVRLDRTYFVEIENWKYCSKIIFKYMNNAVRPICNKKINKKWSLLDRALFTVEKSKHAL